jgi:hypothetical protein
VRWPDAEVPAGDFAQMAETMAKFASVKTSKQEQEYLHWTLTGGVGRS